jgi:hypothetical protein
MNCVGGLLVNGAWWLLRCLVSVIVFAIFFGLFFWWLGNLPIFYVHRFARRVSWGCVGL